MNKENSISIRWFYMVIGVVAMLFAGVLYAWSILKVPFSTDFGWSVSELSLNFTLTMCTFCLGGLLGSFLARKIGVKPAGIVAALLSGGGMALTGFLNGGSIALLYVTYAGLAGLGIGIAYNVIIATVSAWFPDKKGLCSGCLMMGFGVSTLLLGSVISVLFETPAFGWSKTYILLGGLIAGVSFLPEMKYDFPLDRFPALAQYVEGWDRGLEIGTLGRGPDHLVILNGETIGEYNHPSKRLHLYEEH